MDVIIGDILLYLEHENFEYKFVGNKEDCVKGFSALSEYRQGTVTWIKTLDNWKEANVEPTLVVVQEGIDIPVKNQIITDISKNVFFSIIEHFWEDKREANPIGHNTYIGENVKIGEGVTIGHNCSIDGDIYIGANTHISDNVVIKNRVHIGENCEIQGHVIIGEDGFGCYEDENHKKTMVRHHGGVYIGNDVFIGAKTDISRGTLGDTKIGDGVKISDASHIGHNNIIGEDTILICSQTYGSVHIGSNAYIVGSVIKNQCTVGKDAYVCMGSVVISNVDDNMVVAGAPARAIRRRYDDTDKKQ